MRPIGINNHRPMAFLVLIVAVVVAAIALLGVMADVSGAAAEDTTRVSVDSSSIEEASRESG
jgi:hypothetical protein